MTNLIEYMLCRSGLDVEDANMELVIRKKFGQELFHAELRCSPEHVHAKGDGATVAEALYQVLFNHGVERERQRVNYERWRADTDARHPDWPGQLVAKKATS